jgi:hypothetical protein
MEIKPDNIEDMQQLLEHEAYLELLKGQ